MNTTQAPADASSPVPGALRYWAFISYSRADKAAAAWLHRAIERYTLPRKLIGRGGPGDSVPRRLFPLFRDREELSSSTSLSDSLDEALRQSRNLIVLCSPHAASSQWVNQEVLQFKRLGKSDRVFCAIVSGEPNASDHPERGQPEAFPPALRFQYVPDTQSLSGLRAEPLAADLRPGGDGRRLVLLKLVAGLLNLPLDDLIARDRRRRRWRGFQVAALALSVLLVGGGVWLNERGNTTRQRQVAAAGALATRAQGLLDGDTAQLPTAALLAVEAWHRALRLGLSADEVLDVMQRSAALMPTPEALRLQSANPLETGIASRDGRWLATPGDKSVLLWDAGSGRLSATLPVGEDVAALAFGDGEQLIVVAGGEVQTWATPSGSRVGTQRVDGLSGAALSADGRWLAGTRDSLRDIGVWDVAGARLARSFEVDVPVNTLALSPDGRRLAAGVAGQSNSGPVDPGLRLWNLVSGAPLGSWPQETYVETLAFSPGGRFVAVGSGARIQWRDAATGREVSVVFHSGAGNVGQRVASLALSPNERWFATSQGTTVQVWDGAKGEEVARLPSSNGVLTFSADGQRLFTTDGRAWSMNTAAQLDHLLVPPDDKALDNIKFGGNAVLAGASQAGSVTLWHLDKVQQGPMLREGPGARVVAFSADARFLLTMAGNTLGSTWEARLWEAGRGRRVASIAPGGQIDAMAFSSGGELLAVADRQGALTVYATRDARVIARNQTRTHGGAGHTLAFVPSTETLAIVTGSGEALLWQPRRGPLTPLQLGENRMNHMAASGDGRTLWLAGDKHGVLSARDPLTGNELRRSENLGSSIQALAVSLDGDFVAAAGDGVVYLIDGNTGGRLADLPLQATSAPPIANATNVSVRVNKLVFSDDGQWLAIVAVGPGGEDAGQSVSLCHLSTRTRVAALERAVQDVEFSPDARRMAVLGADGSVHVREWVPTQLVADLCARVGRDLNAREQAAYFDSTEAPQPCRPSVSAEPAEHWWARWIRLAR